MIAEVHGSSQRNIPGQLGLSTIAEGVENQEQVDAVKAMGCDEVQGFLYAKPMPADALFAYLKTKE